jgi:DNA repair protein RadC
MSKKTDSNEPHYVGHRKRLKEKFLSNDAKSLQDYEILELLLFQAIPRRDVKPLAKKLINQFGNITQLIAADKEKILAIPGTNENVFLNLQIIRELIGRVLADQVIKKHVISSWAALLDYLKFKMSNLKLEQFRVLFLNKKNMLIADEVMATGTIDQTPVYPREIVKKALYHEAGAIILVHNHPSGNAKPSNSDIDLTTQIVNACNTISVTVHDHVIIGNNEYYSFKSNLLL